jgi:hypothetical protein
VLACDTERYPVVADSARNQWPGVAAMRSYEIFGSPYGREHGICGTYGVENRYQATTGEDTADREH